MTDAAHVSKVYVVLVLLASIVAAIGLLHDDVAVIIGSMVIAPLLRPNMPFPWRPPWPMRNLPARPWFPVFQAF
jgi:hypothetical protein